MTKLLTNHDLPTAWWEKQFSSDELRQLAAAHRIKRGRDKLDSAINLKNGKRQDGTITTFTVFCEIPSLANARLSHGDDSATPTPPTSNQSK